jgi:ribulose kinase
MEGVVYGTAVILRRMEANGFAVREMIASGGATSSDLWMQLHADITGVPIVIPEEQQAVSLGSAIAATVAAGMYPSLREAADAMVRIARRIEPDPAVTEVYRTYVDQYEGTYDALKDLSAELVASLE